MNAFSSLSSIPRDPYPKESLSKGIPIPSWDPPPLRNAEQALG